MKAVCAARPWEFDSTLLPPSSAISFHASAFHCYNLPHSLAYSGATPAKGKNVTESFKKGGKPGPGRPKGLKNKTTQTALDAIAQAAEQLGGAKRLVEWAKEDPSNEKVFWGTIYPKLLPLQVSGEGGGPLTVEIIRFGQDSAA